MNAEIIPHLLRQAYQERTTGACPGGAKLGSQLPLQCVPEGLNGRGQHSQQPSWYARTASLHSDTLLHDADLAASHITVLTKLPPGTSQDVLIVADSDALLQLRASVMWSPRKRLLSMHQHTGKTCAWIEPRPRPSSMPGNLPQEPLTTMRCQPWVGPGQYNARFAPERTNYPVCPIFRALPPLRQKRGHDSTKERGLLPAQGCCGRTTARRHKRRLHTSPLLPRRRGPPCGVLLGRNAPRSPAPRWSLTLQRCGSAPSAATTHPGEMSVDVFHYASIGRLCVGAPQPKSGTTSQNASQLRGPSAAMAHRGGIRLIHPSPAPKQRFCGLPLRNEQHAGVSRPPTTYQDIPLVSQRTSTAPPFHDGLSDAA